MVDRLEAGGPVHRARLALAPPFAQGVGGTTRSTRRRAPGAGRPDAMLTLEKKSETQARLSFAKVRWQ